MSTSCGNTHGAVSEWQFSQRKLPNPNLYRSRTSSDWPEAAAAPDKDALEPKPPRRAASVDNMRAFMDAQSPKRAESTAELRLSCPSPRKCWPFSVSFHRQQPKS